MGSNQYAARPHAQELVRAFLFAKSGQFCDYSMFSNSYKCSDIILGKGLMANVETVCPKRFQDLESQVLNSAIIVKIQTKCSSSRLGIPSLEQKRCEISELWLPSLDNHFDLCSCLGRPSHERHNSW